MYLNSSIEIGDERTFQACDGVFEQQLALFQTPDLKLVDVRTFQQSPDDVVQIPVLHPQLRQPHSAEILVNVAHAPGPPKRPKIP